MQLGRFFHHQGVEPARRRIRIQLFVPALLIALPKPSGDAPEFIRRQAIDRRFHLIDTVHIRSLLFLRPPSHPRPSLRVHLPLPLRLPFVVEFLALTDRQLQFH